MVESKAAMARDMYEHLAAYYREHLAKDSSDTVLGRAPEDDPDICDEYRQIIKTPGLGYEFFIEDMNEMAHPVWEWRVNRNLFFQMSLPKDKYNNYYCAQMTGVYIGSSITRNLY